MSIGLQQIQPQHQNSLPGAVEQTQTGTASPAGPMFAGGDITIADIPADVEPGFGAHFSEDSPAPVEFVAEEAGSGETTLTIRQQIGRTVEFVGDALKQFAKRVASFVQNVFGRMREAFSSGVRWIGEKAVQTKNTLSGVLHSVSGGRMGSPASSVTTAAVEESPLSALNEGVVTVSSKPIDPKMIPTKPLRDTIALDGEGAEPSFSAFQQHRSLSVQA